MLATKSFDKVEALESRSYLSVVSQPIGSILSVPHSTSLAITHDSASLSHARGRLVAVTAGGEAIFASGDTITESAGSDIYGGNLHTWIATPSIPDTDGPLAAVSINGRVFLASPSGAVSILDSSDNSWSSASLSESRDFVAAIALENTAFFFAGAGSGNPDNIVDVYDGETDSWSVAHLSKPRSSIAAAAVNGHVVFAGGRQRSIDPKSGVRSNVKSRTVDLFDAATGGWSTARLSQARSAITVATVGTKAIFAGGELGSGNLSKVVDIYDAATGRWSNASLSERRAHMTTAVVGTKVFFAGGEQIGGSRNNRVDIYDAVTGKWSLARLTGARDNAVSVGSKAIFAGGLTLGGSIRDSIADIYDTSTGHWSTAPFSVPRNNIATIGLGTQVFFAGGFGDGGGATSAVDIFTDDAPSGVLTGLITGGSKAAYVTITNSGDAAIRNPFRVKVYASRGYGKGAGSRVVGDVSVQAPLEIGQSIRLKINFTTPLGTASGTYNLIASASINGLETLFASKARTYQIQ